MSCQDASPPNPPKSGSGPARANGTGSVRHCTFDPPFSLLHEVQEVVLGPGERLPARPQHDLELITLVLRGEVVHEDSLGNEVLNGPGTLQVLSAGNGVVHSDVNVSTSEEAVLLRLGLEPRVCQFAGADYQRLTVPAMNGAVTLASPRPDPGGLTVREDFAVVLVNLKPGTNLRHPLSGRGDEVRRVYVHVLEGNAALSGTLLRAGQVRRFENCQSLVISAPDGVRILLLDLP